MGKPTVDSLLPIVEYAQHDSWRCAYRIRYKRCRCGLDDLMEKAGLPPVPVSDPEQGPFSKVPR